MGPILPMGDLLHIPGDIGPREERTQVRNLGRREMRETEEYKVFPSSHRRNLSMEPHCG